MAQGNLFKIYARLNYKIPYSIMDEKYIKVLVQDKTCFSIAANLYLISSTRAI